MPETPEKFYLTTPIYYVNAHPHIGHAYTTIVADVLARRHRLLGHDTFFLTGTDEHGQKIARSAAAANIPPQQFADQVSAEFKKLWDRMGITYSGYIRTTDYRHKRGAQKLFADLYDRGYIYLSSYTGQYCVSEEIFVEGPPGTIGPDGKPTETVTEENFFFKLSEYQLPLIDLIESDTLAITPEARKNEVLGFLRGNVSEAREKGFAIANSAAGVPYVKGTLRDLSVSRSSFTWGIPVPESAASATKKKHVMYVWLDALANYMTAIGYGSDSPDDKAEFARYWPADLHIMAKEITRQHCVYWPAFLLAADLPLPKAVTAHGWLLFDSSKMSKSKGNIVRAATILTAFGDEVYGKQFPDSTKAERDLIGADVLRYFLLREIPFGQDGSFSFDALITRYNADLAEGYGNLVSRIFKMIEKYCNNRIPNSAYGYLGITEFISGIDRIGGTQEGAVEFQHKLNLARRSFAFTAELELIQQFIKRVDQFLSEKKPWKLNEKDAEERIERDHVLYCAADAVKNITFLLHPYMPYSTLAVWKQLGFTSPIEGINQVPEMVNLRNLKWGDLKPGTKLGELTPIFPRAEKGLAQIMTDMEQNAAPKTDQPAAEAKPEAPAAPAAIPVQITIDDFAKLDLRAAKILIAERIPKADKLLRLEVDLGPSFNPARRQILSGIAEWYAPEELVGRMVVVIANLAPRTMRGLESHGMLLAASEGENGKPILATFGEEIAPGARLK